MSNLAVPNLPSRDFGATSAFYGRLGFQETWRDRGWMILQREDLRLEFFPYPDLDPFSSSFGCCLRMDDLNEFYAVCQAASIPEQQKGHPRLHPPRLEPWGGMVGALLDPDGTLLRLIQNPINAAGEAEG